MPGIRFHRAAIVGALASTLAIAASCSSASTPSLVTTGDAATNPSASITDGYWCPDAGAVAGCNGTSICGVCVATPTEALVRTTDTKEYAGTTATLDLGCTEAAAQPTPPGVSQLVAMSGNVEIFANGADSSNVQIDIYEEQLDANGLQTGTLGAMVGTATTAAESTPPPAGSTTDTLQNGSDTVTRYLYPYAITLSPATATTPATGIPTEKPLVIHTSGVTPDAGWFDLYEFNVVARNTDVAATGGGAITFQYNPRVLANDDYSSILETAYNRTPAAGESAIAGEVHDCGDVRMSFATVGLQPLPPFELFYMSEDEDDPLPDTERTSTGKLGLYAVGALAPGVYTLATGGLNNGALGALGSYTISTFANSVSVLTFRGPSAWQIAAPQ